MKELTCSILFKTKLTACQKSNNYNEKTQELVIVYVLKFVSIQLSNVNNILSIRIFMHI